MKSLIVAALALIGTVFLALTDSAATTKHYVMYARGNQGMVRLDWQNIGGLGRLEGSIAGNQLTGCNTAPGKLQIQCKGIFLELTKVRNGNSFQWAGLGYDTNDCSDFEVVLVPSPQMNQPAVSETDSDAFTSSFFEIPGAMNLAGIFGQTSF